MLIVQIGLFVAGVALIYLFGDQIASGAGNLVSELTDSRKPRPEALEGDAGIDEPAGGLPERRRVPALEPTSSANGDTSGAGETGTTPGRPDIGP